ncbi:unnamed protein product [Peniophora sp. CBMAI 1063]|nr:unnamed protein product [Peniophora sp. CBMAI 1063]
MDDYCYDPPVLLLEAKSQPDQNVVLPYIDRLHPEILSHIFFVHARDNDELYTLRWTRVLLVCKRWHDVATGTQCLWSYINISCAVRPHDPDPSDIEAHDSPDVRRIDAQLTRAGMSPLTVIINMAVPMSEAKLARTTMFSDRHNLSSLTMGGSYPEA